MRLAWLCVVMRFLTACLVSTGEAIEVHVAPEGSDANDGTRAKPVFTFTWARDVLRGQNGDNKRIIVHGGDYYDMAFELGPQDSGLTIEAAPGETPVLYGGIPITSWEKDGDRFYSAALPDLKGREWSVRLLQVDNRMCPRARFPAEGTLDHLTSFDVPWMSSTGGGWKRKPTVEELTTLKYKAGDLGLWLEVRNAEITVFHMWDESCVGVAAHNFDTQTLTLSPETGHPPGAFGVKKYVLWNIREGLTAPGQWYHDRVHGRLVYWPLPGQNMAKVRAIAPTQTTVLRLSGSQQDPVKNVTIKGLAIAVTTVPLRTGGFAAASFGGAVSLEHTENCVLDGLMVSRVAGQGIDSRGYCVAARIENCDVSDCGAGGIYVGGSGTLISNNHVHGVGKSYPSSIGIFRGGEGNTVSHNEVHDCSYSGINYGGKRNVIECNLIYDCMKVLHDGAAIYVFGGKNCILRGNLARDISDTGGYGASAYYLDEQSEDCIVEKNVSIRVNWPSHNHMARHNTIRNNVFIVPGDAKLTFPRSSEYTLEKNIVVAGGSITIDGAGNISTWSGNIFCSGTGKVECFDLNQYSRSGPAAGAPGDTVAENPLFENVDKLDFRFKAGSPALKLGIEPVDVRSAGRREGK